VQKLGSPASATVAYGYYRYEHFLPLNRLLVLPEQARLPFDIAHSQQHGRLRALVGGFGATAFGHVCGYKARAAGVDEDVGARMLLLVGESDGVGEARDARLRNRIRRARPSLLLVLARCHRIRKLLH